MSAYVVDHAHIDAILTWASRPCGYGRAVQLRCSLDTYERKPCSDPAFLSEVGRILMAENVQSVLYRYPADTPGMYDAALNYRFRRSPRRLSAVEVLKALNGYDYQACETPEYRHSLARVIVAELLGEAIRALPGYDDSDAWHIAGAAAQ